MKIDHKPRWMVSTLGAVTVALGLLIAQPTYYQSRAVYRVPEGDPATVMMFRQTLIDVAGMHRSSANDPLDSFAVTSGPEESLALSAVARKPGTLRAALTTIEQSWIADITAKRLAMSASASDLESTLAQWTQDFRERVVEARRQVENVSSRGDDPRENRGLLLVRWEGYVAAFEHNRSKIAEASGVVRALQEQPEPERGVVDPLARNAAQKQDIPLQQDLKELVVRLTEARLHLVHVWQAAAQPLNDLLKVAENTPLQRNAASRSAQESPAGQAAQSMQDTTAEYVKLLTEFAAEWNRKFVHLRPMEINPLLADILEAHADGRRLLMDFLFKGAAHITVLREQMQILSDHDSDQAVDVVRQSELIRAFHQLQTSHHRFEFSAGVIEPRQNPQLDAALTASRGFRRRTQQSIRDIDARLSTLALREAKTQRAELIAASEVNIERSRERLDRSITDLVRIQDELNVNAGMTEQFLHDLLAAEAAHSQLSAAEKNADSAERKLQEIRARRDIPAHRGLPFLHEISAPELVNLKDRLRLAAIGGLLSAFSIHACQFWIARKNR